MRRVLFALLALLWALPALAQQVGNPTAPGMLAIPGWVTQSNGAVALLDLDFANNRYWPWDSLGRTVVTRASVALEDGGDGIWYTFPSGQLRLTSRGSLIEESRTNSIRNNTMTGAAIGAPGTQPTNWSVTATGLTVSVAALPVDHGLQCLDESFVGTTGATAGTWNLEAFANPAALYGQTWTYSLFASATNLTNVTGVSLNVTAGVVMAITPTAALQRFSGSITPTVSSTSNIRPSIGFTWANGAAINFTMRVCAPQIENNTLINSVLAAGAQTIANSGTSGCTSGTYTVSGGTGTAATLTGVAGGGVITSLTTLTAGSYTVFPTSPAALTGTGCSGSPTATLIPKDNSASALATSPILTTSAAVTRSADVDTLVLPPGACSTTVCSALGIGTPLEPVVGPSNSEIFELSNGTNQQRLGVFRAGTNGVPGALSTVAGAAVQPFVNSAWAISTQEKISGINTSSNASMKFNNTSDANSSVSQTGVAAVTKINIGSNFNNAVQWNGYISRIVVAPFSLLNN